MVSVMVLTWSTPSCLLYHEENSSTFARYAGSFTIPSPPRIEGVVYVVDAGKVVGDEIGIGAEGVAGIEVLNEAVVKLYPAQSRYHDDDKEEHPPKDGPSPFL